MGLVFGAAEYFLRQQSQSSVSAVGIPIYQNDDLTGYWHQPNTEAENGYGDPVPRIFVDEHGLRFSGEQNKEERTKILLLGDSFTFGTGLRYEDTFAGILDQDFTVFNAGIVGHTVDQYLVRLKDLAPKLQPDLVIANVFVGNDITEFRRHEWDTKGDEILAVKDLKVFATEGGKLRSREQIPPKSYAWNFLMTRWKVFQSKVLHTSPASPTLTWPAFLPADHPHQDPKIEYYWDQFFIALSKMQEYCKNHEIKLIINIIPMDTQVSKHYWDKYAVRHFDEEAFAADRPQKRILEFCETNTLDCLDLLPSFRDHGQKNILYFQNEDPHFDITGHRATAEVLKEWIEANQ